MGALNSPCSLSFICTDDKDHLLPIYWKLVFFHSLSCLKAGSPLSPKSMSDTCWMGQAQLCSHRKLSSHCDPAWLPAIHMCYFPFVVMACGTRPENIINFRSGVTNSKPTVSGEEVPGRPAVRLEQSRRDSVFASARRKGDDNPQRGNALKLSAACIKERRKRKEKRNQRKEKGGEAHTATWAAAGQEIATAAGKSLLWRGSLGNARSGNRSEPD